MDTSTLLDVGFRLRRMIEGEYNNLTEVDPLFGTETTAMSATSAADNATVTDYTQACTDYAPNLNEIYAADASYLIANIAVMVLLVCSTIYHLVTGFTTLCVTRGIDKTGMRVRNFQRRKKRPNETLVLSPRSTDERRCKLSWLIFGESVFRNCSSFDTRLRPKCYFWVYFLGCS